MIADYKEINRLYIVCRELFKERYAELRSTEDKKLSFIDALECELCANTISLCVELFCGLIDSPAVETSCRSILEARSLLKMVHAGDLTDEQIFNFENQSKLLFYGNLFETGNKGQNGLFTDEEEKAMRKKIHWIVQDYEGAVETYKQKYGAEFDERVRRAAIRNGLFFTSNDPSKKKRETFTTLFKHYMQDVDGAGKMYNRVSFFAHPWYLDNLDDFNSVGLARQKDIKRCFEIVQEFFAERINSISDDGNGLAFDLTQVGYHMERGETISSVCSNLYDMAIGTNGRMSYTALCFGFLKNILFEMNVLNGLGYPELALSKFQTVCELWGINGLVNSTENIPQWKAIQQAFDYSTRIQLHKLSPTLDIFANVPTKGQDSLKAAYDAAPYKSAIPFEDYYRGIEGDSFSFLRPFYPEEGTNFLDLARSATSKTFLSNRPNRSKEFMVAYFFSIDVHHATGFCYTENRDCWALLSHDALASIYEGLFVFGMHLVAASDQTAFAMRPNILPMEELISAETEEINELSLKYPE